MMMMMTATPKLRRLLSISLLLVCLNNSLRSQWFALGATEDQAGMDLVKIGVVLDKESMQGKLGLSCINMALSDFYAAHPQSKTRIVIHVRDSEGDVLVAAAAVLDLVKNVRVAAIIGPETSPQAQFIINIGEKAQVPIVSYSATSPFLSPIQNPYFVRATQDDFFQVQPLSALVQAFGWREVVPIYVDDEFGGGVVPSLIDALQQVGTHILYRSVIPSSATDEYIIAELYKLKSMQTRVFIVHMSESLGSRLFLKAKQVEMMSQDYVWIITNSMANVFSSLDHQVTQSMQGVLGMKTYVPQTKELDNFTMRWKLKFQQENPTTRSAHMNVDGLWAYDATTALARAVEEVGITNFTFQRADSSANLSTDLTTFGVSLVGPLLLKAILSAKFRGLSGDVDLVDGQLQSSTFQLINVLESGKQKEIGYWTASSGLVQELTLANATKSSSSNDKLGTIIWPGNNNTSIPKGWVVSPNEKKLQIGVPVKYGFEDFVGVTRNLATNTTKVTGFCIDLFDAVMARMPYLVPYEYIPFAKPNGEPAGDYDELINQVYLKRYDAVVGDTTIRANRSLYVDFTLPYTDSGVIMITPMKDDTRRAWLFVKPLTVELWATTLCFFIFIAFVIWVLEHRINEDFRGPPWHHVGTSLYYSFSTMVFSQSSKVLSNLTRFVVIVWIFVVLILIQSYTANLASLLTVEQLQPTITDVKDLIKNGERVGFQQGSFVYHLLIDMKFNPLQLKAYDSIEQLHELLANGTKEGGIAAAFDEIPFVKLFLSKYCSKYTMVPPTYKSDGFGFAFPIGSPLVSEVSRKVLEVTEGEEMTAIQDKWFKQQQKACPDPSTSVSSSSLSLNSFWGLFTIAGASAMFALLISLTGFLREHRHVWSDRNASVWTRIRTLSRIYDAKNLSSHTFRKNQPHDPSFIATSCSNSPYPQSPSGSVHNSESGFTNYEEQSTQSPVNVDPNVVRGFADRHACGGCVVE